MTGLGAGVATSPESSMAAEHPNALLLRRAYGNLDLLANACADDVVVHSNGTVGIASGDWVGKEAMMSRVTELWRRSGETLNLPVEEVMANDYFGVVLARFTAHRPDGRHLDMPICGVWRFENGTIVEHWENCHDWSGFEKFFEPQLSG